MKKITICGAVYLLLGLLLWGPSPVDAQRSKHRFQTRAKLWNTYWNVGSMGIWSADLVSLYRAQSMNYPGNYVTDFQYEGPDYYGGPRTWPGLDNYQTANVEMNILSAGLETFVATVANGEYYASETKVDKDPPEITMLAYDPSAGPEANIGYESLAPNGIAMANWWPGQPPPGADTAVEILNYRYGQYMDPDKDTFPESIIISHYSTKHGVTVTRKAYAWGYPDYDDFEILEFTFENTGSNQLNDTFIAFSMRWIISQRGWRWQAGTDDFRGENELMHDDWNKYTEAGNYDGPASGMGLKLWYGYDGDSPITVADDLGDPFDSSRMNGYGSANFKKTIVEGELMAYQHAGFAPIAYTPGADNDAGTWTYDTGGDARFVAPRVADQPYAFRWWQFRTRTDFDNPDSGTSAYEKMYNDLSGAPEIMDNPPATDGVHGTFTYGPYDLAPGDKARIVVALVAAAPVEENMWGWAVQGKQAELRGDKGFNNLVKHLNKARDAFDWDYDLPDPPPDVKVTSGVTPEAQNQLTWDTTGDGATDPDYSGGEAQDVVGYRVYRSENKVDNWVLFADMPKTGGSYTFVDEKSAAGFAYDYAVRAYDKGHADWNGTGMAIPSLEGGSSSPEQWVKGGVKWSIPFVPPTAEADQLQRKVRVVPNPYFDDGAHAYPTKDRVRFLNLPQKCKVKIYTAAGDLLTEFTHDDPTRGEGNYDMVTRDVIGKAAAGIYYFVVESQVAGSVGKMQAGTFVVIR